MIPGTIPKVNDVLFYLVDPEDRELWNQIKIEATRRGMSMAQFILQTMRKEIYESTKRVPNPDEGTG